ncbi:MAG: serine hydrolase domain-containing protein [Wenzhouxiangella sp.]
MLRPAHLPMVLLLIAAIPALAAPDARGDREFIDLDREFGRILAEESVPGAAWAIVRDGRIVHASGYGERARGSRQPVTAETVFRVASVSKTFSATLTAMLVGEGLLHWDDAISRFVPKFQLDHPDHARRLQIRHLLGQSTGIVPNAYDNLLDASQSLEQIVPRFAEIEPMCRPGQCYTYQNVLFSLVEPAIEQTTGRSYGQLLDERLFQPLGMEQASTGMAAFLASANRARPHVRRGSQWLTTKVDGNYYRVSPAAGVNASALDLGRWLIGQMGDRPDVIRPELAAELTRKRVRTARELRRKGWRDLLTDAHYGLGWRIYTIGDEEIFMHSGWVRGFVAQIAYSRDRRTGLAIVLNAESSALNEIATHFWRQALAEPLMLVQDERRAPESGSGEVTTAAAVGSGE